MESVSMAVGVQRSSDGDTPSSLVTVLPDIT